MRRRVSRIFTALGRPRVGLSERDVALQLRPVASGIALGAIGLTPSLKCEAPEIKSGFDHHDR